MLTAYKQFWTHILDFSGRTNRKNFWWPILINYLISGILLGSFTFFIADLINISQIDSINKLITNIIYQSIFFLTWTATFSIKIRRLHDINKSSWWILLQFIPLVGTIGLFSLMLLPSKLTRQPATQYVEKPQRLVILLTTILLVSIGSIIQNNWNQYNNELYIASKIPKWSADQEPLLTTSAFNQTLTKFSRQNTQSLKPKQIKTIVIPGLHGAWSLNHQTQKPSLGNNWVPQGLAENRDYYFISAYDGNHRLNSLIFVINKTNGKYLKSLILPRQSHVGGLAADEDHQLLWVSDDTSQNAQVRALTFDQIENYDSAKSQKPIPSKQLAPLPWASRSSGLAYFKNNLLIVKYGRTTNSHSVVDLAVNPSTGLVQKSSMQPVKLEQATAEKIEQTNDIQQYVKLMRQQNIIKSYTAGFKRMQGLAVIPDEVNSNLLTLYTQSNGNAASRLIVKAAKFNGNLDFDTIKKENQANPILSEISLPPSVEQVSADPKKRKISILFEGGATQYRNFKLGLIRHPFIDRLIIFDY